LSIIHLLYKFFNKFSLYFNTLQYFYPTFLSIHIQRNIHIDMQRIHVIIMLEYEILAYISVLSADFRNKASAFFIFDNTAINNRYYKNSSIKKM